jgi:type IV secretory pathway TraG/TraD family ATPase VirD4
MLSRETLWQWDAAAVLIGLPLALAVGSLLRLRTSRSHRRGTLVLEGARARHHVRVRRRRCGAGALTLAGIPLAPLDETKHFKLIGTTGTGKSTAIRELVDGALRRGDRAVIADPDGGYLARLRDRNDVILNPFEPGSCRWDPFAEIRHSYDVEMLASSLIPAGEDSSGREWRSYARTFFTAVARRCFQEGRRETAELWRLLLVAPPTELFPIVAGSSAQPFLEAENARMFGSIRAVAGSALAALEYIAAQRGRSLSVREWVRSGHGVLFLPYQATQIAALHSIIATWLRLAIFEAMNGPEQDRRLWFIVDELDALGVIEGLKDALARLRKFGGRCVLGFQSVAQVSGLYGGDAQTIIENCANTLILRCSSSEHGGTSQFASRLIGEREVVRQQKSRGRDTQGFFSKAGGFRRSTQVNEQYATESAVMPSELEQLPDLSGYLKAASSPAWLKVALPRERNG